MVHNGHIGFEIEHCDDGSAMCSYEHEDKLKSARHAVADLDAIHDSLEDYLREQEEEEKKEEDVHPGIHDEIKHPEDEE
jgi:hypothetical protein